MMRKLVYLMSLMLIICLTGYARGEILALSDDFSGDLSANWITGTNSSVNPDGPAVVITEGRVENSQNYDYIKTKESFSGDKIQIQVDVERKGGSVQCLDFAVEFVEAGNLSGIVRFRYGSENKDSINIGQAPITEGANENDWDCIKQGGYLNELDSTEAPYKGTASLTYQSGTIQFAFTNEESQEITTPQISTDMISETKIRIWMAGSERYLDNVRIYADTAAVPQCECGDSDKDGVPDDWDQCPETLSGAYTDANGCDIMADGKQGLAEIIYRLQVLAGMKN